MTPTPKVKDIADHTTSVVDGLHDTPRLPAYRFDGAPPSGKHGRHSRAERRISVNPAGPWPYLTAAHELGHAISRNVLSAADRRAVLGAADQSRLLAALRNRLMAATTADLRDYLRYLLKDEEVWARAYSQWVAIRSGDRKLLADLRRKQARGVLAGQWSDADFAPIAAEIDRVFRSLGWLK